MAGRLQFLPGMQALLKPALRTQELWREFGPRATIGLGLKKLVSPVARIGSLYLMECDLTAGIPQAKPIPGIVAREAFLEEIGLLDGLENEAEKKRDAIQRFKRGDRWFVGIDNTTGKLANFRWVTTSWELVPELECNVVPEAGQAFAYALYTAPEYRRRGIDSFTRQYTYDVLYRTAGIKTVLATIFAENTVSIKASQKFLRKIGRVWYLSVLGGHTRVFWWPNPKMPTLAPVPRPAPSAEAQVLDKA